MNIQGSPWIDLSFGRGSFGGGNNNLMGGGRSDAQTRLLNLQGDRLEQMIGRDQFGLNLNTFSNVIGGINSLGQLWGAYQGHKLAKDQWKTQKSILNTNMLNQIQSYNNSLKDRLDTRAHVEGRDQASADKQYEERKARRY